jgi:pimeloyl-ACP methyl ester carboxylesterase
MMTGRHDGQSATRYRTATVDGVGVFYREAGPPDAPVDNGTVDTALIGRPGVGEIMLDLLCDIRRNGPTFKAMQQFLRDRQPPTLVAAGVNHEIFPGEVQRQILTGLPGAEFHSLGTGHFALEDQAPEIARLTRGFLGRVLAAGLGS